ncbi:hypothetical protein HPC49_17355 [Pyxidicoccus fallax]|uniref:Uncharacterized protein n=1 Tax=Pyxidicoccus fallax TaxID=394095 RepID=A0A848LKQ9_9BACT|nr:hypothetical protein [Pyxidicoccus fallax]NMO18234.1 hypothetical protein [Pyxidicoccus fallax]NPC79980.1 hypothetical protein [Pyxidicoccus fallax]
MNATKRRRIAAWLLVPLAFGVCLGLLTSRLYWGYFWHPPIVELPSDARPVALSLFQTGPGGTLLPREERDAALRRELEDCPDPAECTYGRVLEAHGAERWLAAPLVPEGEARAALALAGRSSPVPYFHEGAEGFAFVARYAAQGEERTVFGFHSRELKNDVHGYVEMVFRGSEPLGSVHYWYEVAGIEGATGPVLVGLGVFLAYLLTGVVLLGLTVVRLLRRTPAPAL